VLGGGETVQCVCVRMRVCRAYLVSGAISAPSGAGTAGRTGGGVSSSGSSSLARDWEDGNPRAMLTLMRVSEARGPLAPTLDRHSAKVWPGQISCRSSDTSLSRNSLQMPPTTPVSVEWIVGSSSGYCFA